MPFDKSRYPADWKAISLRIRERDKHCCKWCGVQNYSYGWREDGEFVATGHTERSFAEAEFDAVAPPNARLIRIVLTVAHIDHDTTNNSDGNLASLCQLCHLRHDAKQHTENAARTRRARKIAAGQIELSFD